MRWKLPVATEEADHAQVEGGQIISNQSCDEIHEIAYDGIHNIILIWPSNETILGYIGHYTAGSGGSATKYNFYKPNTTILNSIDPSCSGQTYCSPNFPQADQSSAGAAMSIAVDKTTITDSCTTPTPAPCVEVFSIVPQKSSPTAPLLGSVYAHNVTPSGFTYLWSSPINTTVCSLFQGGSAPITGWFPTSFTLPTLADNSTQGTPKGAVYVPTICASTFTGTGFPSDCAHASTTAESGILGL